MVMVMGHERSQQVDTYIVTYGMKYALGDPMHYHSLSPPN
jgi:hypothetical protein